VPIVTLARQCCALLLRPCFVWGQATIQPDAASGHEALAQDEEQYATVWVPTRLPGGHEFMFELVQNAHTGQWRMSYAYGKQLLELSASQQAMASQFLKDLVGQGEVADYWV
jgi:hypothetical protein